MLAVTTKQIVVVGAGLAGLGAAWHLSRRGHDVRVLERAPHPGGRIRSEPRDGFAVDGPEALVSSADRALLDWVAELGLGPSLLPLRPAVTTVVHRGRALAVDPRNHLGVARMPGMRRRAALRLLRLPRLAARYAERIDPDHPERASGLDDRSIADFGRLYFGSSAVERWMSPWVARKSQADEHHASRVLFLHHYRSHWNERLGLLRGAFGEIAERAAEQLGVELGHEVGSLEPRPGGGITLRLRETTRGRERSVDADAVVIATPAPQAARLAGRLLSIAERDAFAEVHYLPRICLALGLRRAFASHPQLLLFPHVEGSPIANAVLEPGVAGGRVPDGRGIAVLSATAAWSAAHFASPDDAVSKTLTEALGDVLSRIHGAELFSHVRRTPRAVPDFSVGRYRGIEKFLRIQSDRRRAGRALYFAGDYLMGPGPDAALRSGYRAARSVESDLGLSAPREA